MRRYHWHDGRDFSTLRLVGLHTLNRRFEVGRQRLAPGGRRRRSKACDAVRSRVLERQTVTVERQILAVELTSGAVPEVALDWTAAACALDTNLVAAPRMELHLQQRAPVGLRKGLPGKFGVFGTRMIRINHLGRPAFLHEVIRPPANPLKPPFYDAEVPFVNRPLTELSVQVLSGCTRTSQDHEPRRGPV